MCTGFQLYGMGLSEVSVLLNRFPVSYTHLYRDLFLLSNITNIFSERKIIIIIPRGYHFKDVKIKLGAGKLVGRGILADASTLDLGAGEIVLADYYSGAAKIKCGMGKIMLEGQMRGRCKLDCGMGEIAASLVAPSEDVYKRQDRDSGGRDKGGYGTDKGLSGGELRPEQPFPFHNGREILPEPQLFKPYIQKEDRHPIRGISQ